MFTFYIENHEPFGPLAKNCPKLDKNKSIVSRFSVFIVYKSAVMSQSVPTGYIPPGNPWEIFFERANPGHPGNFFCLSPCPGAKNDGRIPGGGAKFFQTQRNCSLSLQKNLEKLRKLRDSTNFLFGEFNKTFIF